MEKTIINKQARIYRVKFLQGSGHYTILQVEVNETDGAVDCVSIMYYGSDRYAVSVEDKEAAIALRDLLTEAIEQEGWMGDSLSRTPLEE